MLKLNEFDENERVSVDGKKLVIHDNQNDWYSYIRFKTEPKNTELTHEENKQYQNDWYSYIGFETEPENTELTHEENKQYLKMCLDIVYGEKTFDLKTIDMIISLFQLIDKKKEETDLQSICEIIKDVQYRFENKT